MNQQELADEQVYKRGYNAGFEAGALHAKQQADRIAELENVVNFWKNQYQDLNSIFENYRKIFHPVKQLSDEEIANIWAEHTKVAGTYDVKDIIFPFARALIKEITE